MLQRENRWDEAGQLLADAAQQLERAGADLLLLCTNTMHKVADHITAAVSIPLLHIGDATADAVLGAGITDVGLLGTAFTMEQDFYRQHLEHRGLHVRVASAVDRAGIHRVIYDELCNGVIQPSSRALFEQIIEQLAEAGARGVILGCTEIELLVDQDSGPVPTFPTTSLHAAAAVHAALASECCTSDTRFGWPPRERTDRLAAGVWHVCGTRAG